MKGEGVANGLEVGHVDEKLGHNSEEDDLCDVPFDFPEVVGNDVIAADDPIGVMTGTMAVCLVEVVSVHEDVDPDVEEASGIDVIGRVLDADAEQAS